MLAAAASPLLAGLSSQRDPLPAAARDLVHAARVRVLAPGESLLSAGQRWTSLIRVDSGVLRLYDVDRQGRASNKNVHLDFAFFFGPVLWCALALLADTRARPA